MCFVTAGCLKDMMREYVRRSESQPDMEKLRELLSRVTDGQKLNILQQTKNRWDMTALHAAALGRHTESVKVILNSLTADQQMQLLTVEDVVGKTAVDMASGETADVLSKYKNRPREKADPGEFVPPNSHVTYMVE